MTFGFSGTGMDQPIPKFWERESKFHFQFLGTGMGMNISIPDFWGRECDVPFPEIIGKGNSAQKRVIGFVVKMRAASLLIKFAIYVISCIVNGKNKPKSKRKS